MPRKAKPENESKRLRTERWRENQAEMKRPEASHVDIALAGAVAALMRQAEVKDRISPDLSSIILTATALLQPKYDKAEAALKLLERLRYRKDLPRLHAALMPPSPVTTRS